MDIIANAPASRAMMEISDIAAMLWRDATNTNLHQASASEILQLISTVQTRRAAQRIATHALTRMGIAIASNVLSVCYIAMMPKTLSATTPIAPKRMSTNAVEMLAIASRTIAQATSCISGMQNS
jgi:hypothetical protein